MSYKNMHSAFLKRLRCLTVNLIPIEVEDACFITLLRRVDSIFLALPLVRLTAIAPNLISKPGKLADFRCLKRSKLSQKNVEIWIKYIIINVNGVEKDKKGHTIAPVSNQLSSSS